jgi:transcriptional regulator with XRE-family HTH domain
MQTFMDLGDRITSHRKQKNMSQTGLSKAVRLSREIIERYERNEKKIADTFEVSLDYLVGECINASFDKKNLKRLEDIEPLDEDTKKYIYLFIDNTIKNTKAKKAFAS